LRELQLVIDQLKIPETYPNEYKDKAYQEKMQTFLNQKAEIYVRFAENALR